MEKLIDIHFQGIHAQDKAKILSVLRQLGVDSKEDLQYISENDLVDKVKVVHMRKLLSIGREVSDQEQQSRNSNPDTLEEEPTNENSTTTKKLAIATGVLGGVTAIAAPLAVFAALFPPITLPIAVAVGAGAGVVAAATAGTGIATAIMANKSGEETLEQDESKTKLI